MSFNGSGTFNLTAGNPVVTGTTISSTWANNTLSDIATGLSNCVTRDGQSPATANLPMGGFKATGLASGTSTGDSVRWDQVQYVLNIASAGTSGQVLTSGGTGAPTWTNAATGDVTLTGTQTLTNKTIEAGIFTNGYTEETVTANTSTAYTIDLANGSVQILTLTGSCTFTFPTATAGKSFMLLLKQDATGSRTVTWPASVKWPASTAPTITSTASKGDKYVFTGDGTYWWGSVAGQNYL